MMEDGLVEDSSNTWYYLGPGNPVLPISELSMVCIELELFSWFAC
jgi:hypothetical protein